MSTDSWFRDELLAYSDALLGDGGPADSSGAPSLEVSSIGAAVTSLRAIADTLGTSNFDAQEILLRVGETLATLQEIAEIRPETLRRVFEVALFRYLRSNHSWILGLLQAIGVFRWEESYFNWSMLEGFLSDPLDHVLRIHGLTSGTRFDKTKVLVQLLWLVVPFRSVPLVSDTQATLRIFLSIDDELYLDVGVLRSTDEFVLQLAGGGAWELAANGVASRFSIAGTVSLTNPAEYSTINLMAAIAYQRPADRERRVLVGRDNGTRVEVAELGAELSCDLSARSVEPRLLLRCRGGLLVISFSSLDGFLSSACGNQDIRAEFAFEAAISSAGIRFDGRAGLESIDTNPRRLVGGLTLTSRRFGVALDSHGLRVGLSLGLLIELGPVRVSIGSIGLAFQLAPAQGDGNLGLLDADIGFEPPTEAAISIAAGVIVGAGLLSIDSRAGRYIGALALTIGPVALRAVGILDTRAPGVSGYSFLVVISAEFTPIQLGFGFTLNGVGGLCGIQRSISVPALQDGVRSGSIATLLFARDPVGQATQLITGLQRIFPPTSDRYVFGPMFKLGWGTPTLLTVDIGIILQLPAPIIIALIGTLSASLPRPEAAVVVLNIDIVGVLDTGEKRLSIDASLRDSRVGPFALTGDLALRLQWGNEPDFALSLGGFNPSFTPPPSFPQLRRLALSLGTGSNPRISLSAYLALTSNTLQVGARAELYAEAAGFNILGYVEFHALFIFSPFSFRFNFAAGVALRRGSTVLAGVSVTGQIDGPRPWHVKGSASITILFFDVSVDFDTTFGDRPTPEQIETVDVWARLQPALQDVRNWSATLPAGRSRGVSVASDQEVPARVRLDPMSELAVRQKVLPLDRRLTKLGEGRIEGPVRYRVSAVRIGAGTDGRGGDTVSSQPVEEPFAPGQYETLTDAQRLSRPSFEPMPAGVKVQGAAATTAGAADLTSRTILCRSFRASIAGDDPGASRSVAARLQAQMQSASAAQLTAMRSTGMERYALAPGAAPLVTLAPQTWTLASTDTLSGASGSTGTWGQTADALRSQRTSDPSQQEALQIVPTFERRP